jgi:transposase InsO family protein
VNAALAAVSASNVPNERWSLDFVSNCFSNGRRFRILAIVDDFTRESLALIPDTSLSGTRVARELDALIARRGRPKCCVSDNGTELTSKAILNLTHKTGVDWHYIAPGKPQQNAFVEVRLTNVPALFHQRIAKEQLKAPWRTGERSSLMYEWAAKLILTAPQCLCTCPPA